MSYSLKNLRSYCGISRRAFHTSRCLWETHYDVLKLKPTCTGQEIRNSFITLSKQYHPDANQNNAQAHSKFIKINEAYSILSKPSKRQDYDFLLQNDALGSSNNWDIYTNSPGERIWKDETIWHMRDGSKDGTYKGKPYYGIKGLKRVSNTVIVLVCVIFTAVGVGLQFLAIRSSFTMSREVLDERSMENSKTLLLVRQQAESNGNQLQLQLLRQRLHSSEAD